MNLTIIMDDESFYWTTFLSSHYFSKNTTSIIINYLTDPPILPYLEELQYRTRCVYRDPDCEASF